MRHTDGMSGAIIANWTLPLGTLVLSIVIGVVTVACMIGVAAPQKAVASRRIVAAATMVPTLILLLGLGFAAPMPPVGPKAAGLGVAEALCGGLAIAQLVTLTYPGIGYSQKAAGPAPMRAAGAVTGCVLLAVLSLLAWLGAVQALAGASL